MKPDSRRLLDKSADTLEAAEILLKAGKLDAAVGRSYYAMFYVAGALLHERGLHSRKHSGVHSLYGQHFAKTGLLDPTFHDWLLRAFERRLKADYWIEAPITPEDVQETLAHAREFLHAAEHFLA